MAYTDGEVRQQFSICFRARYLGGEPTPSDESSEVRWVARGRTRRAAHPPVDAPAHRSRLRARRGALHRLTCEPTSPSAGPPPATPVRRDARSVSPRLRAVSRPDLREPLLNRQVLPVRSGCHVREPQRISRRGVLPGEFGARATSLGRARPPPRARTSGWPLA